MDRKEQKRNEVISLYESLNKKEDFQVVELTITLPKQSGTGYKAEIDLLTKLRTFGTLLKHKVIKKAKGNNFEFHIIALVKNYDNV